MGSKFTLHPTAPRIKNGPAAAANRLTRPARAAKLTRPSPPPTPAAGRPPDLPSSGRIGPPHFREHFHPFARRPHVHNPSPRRDGTDGSSGEQSE
jgi:hypothetical protein